MAIVYLTEQHAWVGREGECLVVHIPEDQSEKNTSAKKERKVIVPLMKVEDVIVLGDVTLSTPALTSLLEAKVHITYLTVHGRYLGTLSPGTTKNSTLRLAQHDAHKDGEKRHVLARQFVLGKLRNMRTIVQRYQRSHTNSDLVSQIETIKRCMNAASQTGSPQEAQEHTISAGEVEGETDGIVLGRMNGLGPLLGCEGAGSAAYFTAFQQCIKCGWEHGFTKRVRRPPTDPINAMLGYGYSILTAQVASAVATVGFDPYIGYLHSARYGKPALALDLVEEFRPVIVDSVVLQLFNNHQVSQKDFVTELGACRMEEATKRLFLQKFEDRMQETIKHPVFGYAVAYRRCIELQARLLAKYLTGEVESYIPFVVR